MKAKMATAPMPREMAPARTASAPQLRPHRALLHEVQLGRQRAGAQQQRQVGGAVGGEVAGDLARAAQDGGLDHRVGDHLAVQHDGEATAHIGGGGRPESLRARAVEAERDHRLAGLGVEGRRGPDQHVAGDEHAALHQHALGLGRVFAGQALVFRRGVLGGVGGAGGLVQQLEGQLGGLADHLLQPLRVALARGLDHDAVQALADDGRFAGAELVDVRRFTTSMDCCTALAVSWRHVASG